jgi:hypothetical protein
VRLVALSIAFKRAALPEKRNENDLPKLQKIIHDNHFLHPFIPFSFLGLFVMIV